MNMLPAEEVGWVLTCHHEALTDHINGHNDRLCDQRGDSPGKEIGQPGSPGFAGCQLRGCVQAPTLCGLQRCQVHLQESHCSHSCPGRPACGSTCTGVLDLGTLSEAVDSHPPRRDHANYDCPKSSVEPAHAISGYYLPSNLRSSLLDTSLITQVNQGSWT